MRATRDATHPGYGLQHVLPGAPTETDRALKGKPGYPKPKSKKKGLGSFRLTGSKVVSPHAMQLPRLARLRLKERDYLPTRGVKIRAATVKRLQRTVSRTEQGSANRKKAAHKLGKEHRRVANQRAETLHHLTTDLAKTKSVIVSEDVHVSGLLNNRRLAHAIADVGFAEFRRRLAYKAQWYGSHVVVVSR